MAGRNQAREKGEGRRWRARNEIGGTPEMKQLTKLVICRVGLWLCHFSGRFYIGPTKQKKHFDQNLKKCKFMELNNTNI